MGMGMLMFAIFGALESITHLRLLNIGGIVGLIYISWGVGQFFGKHKILNYLKSFSSYILGMITFWGLAIGLGFAIDFIS